VAKVKRIKQKGKVKLSKDVSIKKAVAELQEAVAELQELEAQRNTQWKPKHNLRKLVK